MSDLDFPFAFDPYGRTRLTDREDHVRDMIEQVLLTGPAERPNRPDFGSGLLQMVFAPSSPEVAAALQFTVQAALQRWLGDVIEVQSLEVSSEDSTLFVRLDYLIRASGQTASATVTRSASP